MIIKVKDKDLRQVVKPIHNHNLEYLNLLWNNIKIKSQIKDKELWNYKNKKLKIWNKLDN